MTALYERGALRVQPASFFAAASHNGAVRDDELSLPLSVAVSRDDIVKLVVNPEDVPRGPVEQRVDVEFRFDTDYWLYCLTISVEPRLFVDFCADACVIVRDKEAFRERLRATTAAHLAGAAMREGPAIYIDPLLPTTTEIFIPLAKHFRYSYQEELRFVWLPPTRAEKLAHVDVEIGSLKEIAELIVL